jgi:hypothetical protein
MRGLADRWLAFGIAGTAAIFASCSSGSSGRAACNTLVDDGPDVSFVAMATAAPVPTGGTIAEGTYELSALTLYTGPGGSTTAPGGTFSAVFEISGNTMQQVGSEDGVEKRYTSTFTISGSTVSTVDSCPVSDSSTHSLSATPTELRIYDSGTVGTLEQAYAKR